MNKKNSLKEKLVELKLEKRELVLLGKNTSSIDELIKEIEKELKDTDLE